MASIDRDDLGNRMKAYEQETTAAKAAVGKPMIVRLDGKSFHTFTRGLARPYDARLSKLMVETTKALVEKFHAKVGYTQSDEITLVFYSDNPESLYMFDGRYQKNSSVLASFASVFFNRHLAHHLPEKAEAMPIFDARTFVVPDLTEAWNNLVWRQADATKNAISMAAQSMFSHKSLQNLNGKQLQEKMLSEKNVSFDDYPSFFKRGTFVKSVAVMKKMTKAEMATIPEKYRTTNAVCRTEQQTFDWWLVKQPELMTTIFK